MYVMTCSDAYAMTYCDANSNASMTYNRKTPAFNSTDLMMERFSLAHSLCYRDNTLTTVDSGSFDFIGMAKKVYTLY